MIFLTFNTWSEVLQAASSGVRLWYHAPMDRAPAPIEVIKVFKNGKLRVRGSEACYTFDSGHLSRMRYIS